MGVHGVFRQITGEPNCAGLIKFQKEADEDRIKNGLPANVPRRTVSSLEVDDDDTTGARDRVHSDDDCLAVYEMTGLMAESDDEGDGDCDVLEVEDFTSVLQIGNGDFENIVHEQFLGFELSDFSAGDICFCGERESDGEMDPYEFAHMSR